ncbi:hypothetical protein ACFSVK_00130 [Azorhizophilus paspali]|uniref:hypothetical protein n=1 Tax=Azorhizophilus paspali TaxID=69963 RepID=UPI0036299845
MGERITALAIVVGETPGGLLQLGKTEIAAFQVIEQGQEFAAQNGLVATEAKSLDRQFRAAGGHLLVAAFRQGQVEALGREDRQWRGLYVLDQAARIGNYGREDATDRQVSAQGEQRPQRIAHRLDSFPRSWSIRPTFGKSWIRLASILEGGDCPAWALSA